MTKIFQWIISTFLSLEITGFFGFLLYMTESEAIRKSLIIMLPIIYFTGLFFIKIIMWALEEVFND